MILCGLMLARNEAWCIGLSARAALKWCDLLIVLDHASTDATVEILHQVAADGNQGRLRILRAKPGAWNEMQHRQATLDYGRDLGATHFAVVDADELLTGNLLPDIRGHAEELKPGHAREYGMVSPTHLSCRRRIDGPWGQHCRIATVFRDAPGAAWADQTGGYQHHQRLPNGIGAPRLGWHWNRKWDPAAGGVFHLQSMDRGRLEAKAVWYKLVETLRWPGRSTPAELNRKYDWTLKDAGGEYADFPAEWWAPYGADVDRLDPHREPWQLADAARMLSAHPDAFLGLDLHGIDRIDFAPKEPRR